MIWRFPEMGYPQIIHLNGIFHYKTIIFDTPMTMDTPRMKRAMDLGYIPMVT